MSIILYNGFDHLLSSTDVTNEGWFYTAGSDPLYGTAYGRFGGNGIYAYGTNSSNRLISVPMVGKVSGNVLFGAMAINPVYWTSSNVFLVVGRGTTGMLTGSGTTTSFYLAMTTSGVVTAYGPTGTALGTFSMPLNQYHWLEWKVTALSGTSGALTIKLNGVNALVVTGVNTAGTSATGSNWSLTFGSVNGSGFRAYYDDLVLFDDNVADIHDFIGDCRIITSPPISVDTAGAWAANTGTLYDATDDTSIDGDTTYIQSSTAADAFFLGMAALGLTPTSILCAQAAFMAKKTGTDGTTFTPRIKSAGNVVAGTAVALTTSYAPYQIYAATDPATGAAWTLSGANAIKIGGLLS